MQSDPSSASQQRTEEDHNLSLATPTQHGIHEHGYFSSPSLSHNDDRAWTEGSATEWSLSPSPSLAGSSPRSGAGISLSDSSDNETPYPLELDASTATLRRSNSSSNRHDTALDDAETSIVLGIPEEVLFQIIALLPPSDLLALKLVSRRFYDAVRSPTAWMRAFATFFPGAESTRFVERYRPSPSQAIRPSRRVFTRITPSLSWSAEYFIRTTLLDCLRRGRPALPFAAAVPGQPGRGYATFTFNAGMSNITNLHADFGKATDKRKPQFIHGCAFDGNATSSDRKGKFGSWTSSLVALTLQDFVNSNPRANLWGLGDGDVVGVPNFMDVSQPSGIILCEGVPGGRLIFQYSSSKTCQFLDYIDLSPNSRQDPERVPSKVTPCCAWIAKSSNIPKVSGGLLGMLCGTSDGVISGFSLGTPGPIGRRLERGSLTVNWLVCPGVPIVALAIDESYTEERNFKRRVWAVAMNALGELYYLSDIPKATATSRSRVATVEPQTHLDAWNVGRSLSWALVKNTKRTVRDGAMDDPTRDSLGSDSSRLSPWLRKSPIDIRATFSGWDMRRYLEVDFASHDGDRAGEAIVVVQCGHDKDHPARLTRHVRKTADGVHVPEELQVAELARADPLEQDTSWSFAAVDSIQAEQRADSETFQQADPSKLRDMWVVSELRLSKSSTITCTALDNSTPATLTLDEDYRAYQAGKRPDVDSDDAINDSDSIASFHAPGSRARFIAAGTAAGKIYVWDVRGRAPDFSTVSNTLDPVRVIQTDSPGVCSIALTALCLVHGGAEGLVQAWDPLGSTPGPVRTICASRLSWGYNRRSAINRGVPINSPPPARPGRHPTTAAVAICLDPNPAVLRGVAVVGSGSLKYWSFSSVSADDSRSKKRRGKKSMKDMAKSSGLLYSGSYRTNRRDLLHDRLNELQAERSLDKVEMKENKRFEGRFGLNLLGDHATDEEMLAYATMLSQEHLERDTNRALAATISKDASKEEIEAYKSALSPQDQEKWRYASWSERLDLPISRPAAISSSPDAAVLTETQDGSNEADDITEAIKRSLGPELSDGSPTGAASSSRQADSAEDLDLDEAIARSLAESERSTTPQAASPSMPSGSTVIDHDEDDLARAIRMSLQDQGQEAPTGGSQSPTRNVDEATSPVNRDAEFPALTPPSSSGRSSKGKGKDRAWTSGK